MLKAVSILILPYFIATQALAVSVTGEVAPEEWQFLPVWCRYTQTRNPYVPKEIADRPSAGARQLINRVGKEGWLPLHHYCWGLAKFHRSYRLGLSREERRFLLRSAISEMDFVLRNAPPDFVMRPELLTKQGSILLLLGDLAEAEEKLRASLRQDPSYWPPYGYLSDVYKKQGKIQEARKVLQEGLEIAPDAVGLKQKLSAL